MPEKINLLDFDRDGLIKFFSDLGEKPYRAAQLLKWVHSAGVTDFALMSNLSKKLQQTLQASAEIKLPEIARQQVDSDGTIKWLLRLDDGNSIEMVYIPETTRGTLCISSQVGCALNCDFCSTGKQGFNRNLRVSEIIGQLWLAVRELEKLSSGGAVVKGEGYVSNVVLMGMGEPLLNYPAVLTAVRIMLDDIAYNLAKRKVTLSTSGIVPMMRKLSAECDIALAVSLHAPNDQLRDQLVPVNKKYPLKELIAACHDHFKQDPRRKITFEYVMLNGINDSEAHARELLQLLRPILSVSKINLIPFNSFPHAPYQSSSAAAIQRFSDILQKDLFVMVRKPRGREIDGACGQLAGKVADKSYRSKQWHNRVIQIQTVTQG